MKAGKAADLNQKPVGTGPFIFRSYTKDATIRFDGNPDYWKPNDVKISKLIFAITPDAGVRVQKTQARRMPGDELSASGRHRAAEGGKRALRCRRSRASTSATCRIT